MSTPAEHDALLARIAELEARMNRLEQVGDRATSGDRHTDTSRTDDASPAQNPLPSPAPSPVPSAGDSAAPTDRDDPYWLLTGLKDRHPDVDVVMYGGTLSSDSGGYRWQYGLPTDSVLAGDFADAAPALTALAHPVRLALVQAVLAGTHATADLSALPGLGTSGQVYHHLNLLASGGWLRSPRRGHWEVPGERTIPLLALIMAAST